MSRIHEALKKAASERAAQLEGKPLIEQVEMEIAGDTLVEDALDLRLPREARKGMVELRGAGTEQLGQVSGEMQALRMED